MNLYDLMEGDVCSGRHKGNERSIAANAVAAPGKATMRVKIAAFVALQGRTGATLHEIAEHLGKQVNQISGRLSELCHRDKMIFDSKTVRSTPNGASGAVYVISRDWIAEEQR